MTVSSGSMMTRSPFLVSMVGDLTGDWSHTSGPRAGLMNPAAKARMMSATINVPIDALVFAMTDGIAGTTRMTCATAPTAVPTQSVLNRPHLLSATMPPQIGITYARNVNMRTMPVVAAEPRPSAPADWFDPAGPGATAPVPGPPFGSGLLTKLFIGPCEPK